jgi:hypothetical protein
MKHLGRLIPNEVVYEYEKKVARYAIVPDSVSFWRRLLRWVTRLGR